MKAGWLAVCLLVLAACGNPAAPEQARTDSVKSGSQPAADVIADSPEPGNASQPQYPAARLPSALPLPPVEPVPALSQILPGAELQTVRQTPGDVKIHTDEEACEITRGAGRTPPAHLKSAGTSPDGTNALYVDDGYAGGDHNVFDQVSAIIIGKDKEIAIITQAGSIRVKTKTKFGASVNYSKRELTCGLAHNVYNPATFGPLTHYAHNADLSGRASKLWVRGRVHGDCLTMLDENSSPLLTVFPKAIDAGIIYRLVREIFPREEPNTRFAWLPMPPIEARGVKVKLAAPVHACANISHAILLADMPEMSMFGIRFPEH